MAEGGCACGNLRIKVAGEPSVQAICHCSDCRKITGSTFSTNMVVDGSGVQILSGSPKKWSKTADSGNTVTSHFCGDCGSTLFRTGASFGDNYVIKVGVLDEASAVNNAKPTLELFAPARIPWVQRVPGTTEAKGMPGT